MSSFTSTTTITHLVSFLTRPLMRAHAPKTILALQRHLLAAFTAPDFVATEFLLSADCPPPPTLQVACLVSGIRWAEWIRLLSAGLDLRVILEPTELVVELGTRRLVRVASSAIGGGVNSLARPRSAAINPTRVPTSLSSCYSASDDEEEEDYSDSESESDVESDSGCSAASSATSVEDVCAKPIPILRPTPFLLRKPTAKATQVAAQRYLYDGGVTQVLSGGVMLGSAAAAPTPKRAAPTPVLPKLRIPSARPAPALRGSLAGGVQRKTAPDAAMSWRRAL
ncbi:hypothetical protein FB45DRAFT_899289 [Roridomyces roridus]|uniref:Anti-proliferative protein domain-containing protein n=1 Tax=Roridomyces roridus TaxID=1738132 RepID=A0AAD7FSH3_9AGAR|nr:hypothetical protein FB45DRAFT_899289 [Roridomyces roridus]